MSQSETLIYYNRFLTQVMSFLFWEIYYSYKCIEKVEIQAKAYFKLFWGKKLENKTDILLKMCPVTGTF